MDGWWTTTYRYHTWQQGSLPGTHRGEYSRFYTLKRGTPTSTASTRTTQAPERAEPFYPLRHRTPWPTRCRSLLRIHHRHFPFKGRPSRRAQTVPYQNCDRYNTFAVVTPIQRDLRYQNRSITEMAKCSSCSCLRKSSTDHTDLIKDERSPYLSDSTIIREDSISCVTNVIRSQGQKWYSTEMIEQDLRG